VLIETPENPTLHLNDIEGLSKLTEKHRIPLMVDNTFASPYLQQPFRLGADIVVHSMTKYINGISSLLFSSLSLLKKITKKSQRPAFKIIKLSLGHSTSIGGVLLGPWEYVANEAFIYYKDLGIFLFL